MSAPATQPTSLGVSQRPVEVGQLPVELARLWSDVSAEVERSFGQPPVHTSILTLVVVARGRADERIVDSTLAQLAHHRPSRAIVVHVGDADGSVQVDVSAQCRRIDADRITCYDVIELRVPSSQLRAVPSLLEPLELFDVPTFIWWVSAVDFNSSEFRLLTASVERVIVDTSRFDDAVMALLAYSSYLERSGSSCTGTDLTWARVASWRELIAQSFDNPLARTLLQHVQSVEIDFDPAAEAQALLLVGWLASRLGWSPAGGTRKGPTTTLRGHNGSGDALTVTLNRQTSGGVGLRAVRMLAAQGARAVRVTVRRRDDRLVIASIETAGMRQERVIPDGKLSTIELVESELLIHSRDRLFEQALTCATDFLTLIEGNHG